MKVPLIHFLQTGSDLLCSVTGPSDSSEDLCYFADAGEEGDDYFFIEFPMPCGSNDCSKSSSVTVQITQGLQNLNWILPEENLTTSL